MKMSKTWIIILAVIFSGCSSTSSQFQSQIEDLAEDWVISGWTGKQAAYDMVLENMDENGVNNGARYVGFGFNWNPDAEEGMIVTNVMAGGPADGVLQVGDEFLNVNGVVVTEENYNNGKLSFQGKPGVPVQATILREGTILNVSVTRGIVSPMYSKERILESINMSSEENWNSGLLDYKIVEKVSDPAKRIVYLKTWTSNNDDVSGLDAESYSLIRFEFTSEGKVLSVNQMSEDELVLRQTGWNITR